MPIRFRRFILKPILTRILPTSFTHDGKSDLTVIHSVADPGCLSRIPDPTFFHPGSRILNKEFKYFNPKKAKKWFLSSKKYDPGCSSRIPDPDADFLPSRISDPGVKRAPNHGSRIPDPDPQHWSFTSVLVYIVLCFSSAHRFIIFQYYWSVADPWNFCVDPDPAIHASD
jgi:hypothetical protein